MDIKTAVPELTNHSWNGSNITTVLEKYDVFPVPVQVILIIFLICAACVSIVGNIIACMIVYRKTVMRSAINLLLANMATGDVLLTLFCLPFIFYQLLTPTARLKHALCAYFDFVQLVLVSTVAYTLVAISADRYLIIVRRRDKLTPKAAKCIICAIWCCSVVLSCPLLTDLFRHGTGTGTRAGGILCGPDITIPSTRGTFTVVTICVSFYFPMTLMCYTYISILRTVQKMTHKIHNYPGSTISVSVTQYSHKLGLPPVVRPLRQAVDMHTKRRAFGTIFILYVVFFCCWFPYMVNMTVQFLVRTNTTTSASGTTTTDSKATVVLLCLGFLKSALYPVVYGVRNKKFREACFKFFPKSLKLPDGLTRFKQRRINPSAVYECSEFSTSEIHY